MVGRVARALPAWVSLACIVVASALFRTWLGRRMPGPFIMVDELIYSELAKSFAATGRFLVRDLPTGGYGLVYPVLISPAYRLFQDVPSAYAAVKAINSVLMSLAAIPAYLLARRLLAPGLSLLAALLAVAVPSMVYTGTVMTENVFYPLFLLVALALVLVLERPTVPRQLVLLALVGLAFATRAQALAVVPALLVAPLLLALFQGRNLGRALRPFAPLYGLVLAGAAAVVAGQLARGRSLRDLLGAYAVVGDAHYGVRTVADFALWHVADLDLYLGVLPLAAAILLVARARRETRPVQAFLAAAIPLAVSLTLVVAAFASQFASRIQERNLFVLAPLLLIALLVWVDRLRAGVSPPPALALAAAALAALLPLTIPFARFVETGIISDTLALIPVWTAYGHLLRGSVDLTVGAVCVGLGSLVVLAPRRAALALPLVTLAWFALLLEPIFHGPHGFEQASAGAVFQGIRGVDRDWIDDALPRGTRVAVLWSGRTDRFTVNQNEFFNRSVGQVYYEQGPTPGGLYERRVTFGANGLARTEGGRLVEPRYLLVDGSLTPDGVPVARDPLLGMTVWRLRGPLVSTTVVTGLYPNDTWSGPRVTWTRRRCRGGALSVSISSDPSLFPRPQRIRATTSGGGARPATTSVRLDPTRTAVVRVPLHAVDGVCVVRFAVTPTAVPRDVLPGNTDPRLLGAHFNAFDYRGPGLR